MQHSVSPLCNTEIARPLLALHTSDRQANSVCVCVWRMCMCVVCVHAHVTIVQVRGSSASVGQSANILMVKPTN